MQKYNYIFHHVDLDGWGVQFLGVLYSLSKGVPCRTRCCSYGGINSSVRGILQNQDIEEIIIGDLSVNDTVAQELDALYKSGVKIRLRDHHETALDLTKYEWALIKEADDNNILRSGTWWLSQDEDMLPYYEDYKVLIHAIDEWDTWRWKQSDDPTPVKLNALFNILGGEGLINYIMTNPIPQTKEELFTEEANIRIDSYFRIIEDETAHIEARLSTINLWIDVKPPIKLKTGVIFTNNHISEIGDKLLNKHPELDVLMIVCFPFSISWRTIKNLPIPLSVIAKMATGKGGGHPKAAGSSIPGTVFQKMFVRFLDENFSARLDYSNFELP